MTIAVSMRNILHRKRAKQPVRAGDVVLHQPESPPAGEFERQKSVCKCKCKCRASDNVHDSHDWQAAEKAGSLSQLQAQAQSPAVYGPKSGKMFKLIASISVRYRSWYAGTDTSTKINLVDTIVLFSMMLSSSGTLLAATYRAKRGSIMD